MSFPFYLLLQLSFKKSQIREGTSLNWFLLQSGPKLILSLFKPSWLPLSVTSWNISPLNEKRSQQGWGGPCSADGRCCVKEMRQAVTEVLRSQPKLPTGKESLQPGLGFRARLSVQKYSGQLPECLRELLTHGGHIRLIHVEKYLGPLNSTVATPWFHCWHY